MTPVLPEAVPDIMKMSFDSDSASGETDNIRDRQSAKDVSSGNSFPFGHSSSRKEPFVQSMCSDASTFGVQVCIERKSVHAAFIKNVPLYYLVGEHALRMSFKPVYTEAPTEKIQVTIQAGDQAPTKMVRLVTFEDPAAQVSSTQEIIKRVKKILDDTDNQGTRKSRSSSSSANSSSRSAESTTSSPSSSNSDNRASQRGTQINLKTRQSKAKENKFYPFGDSSSSSSSSDSSSSKSSSSSSKSSSSSSSKASGLKHKAKKQSKTTSLPHARAAEGERSIHEQKHKTQSSSSSSTSSSSGSIGVSHRHSKYERKAEQKHVKSQFNGRSSNDISTEWHPDRKILSSSSSSSSESQSSHSNSISSSRSSSSHHHRENAGHNSRRSHHSHGSSLACEHNFLGDIIPPGITIVAQAVRSDNRNQGYQATAYVHSNAAKVDVQLVVVQLAETNWKAYADAVILPLKAQTEMGQGVPGLQDSSHGYHRQTGEEASRAADGPVRKPSILDKKDKHRVTLYCQALRMPFTLPLGPTLPYKTQDITAWNLFLQIASQIAQEDQWHKLQRSYVKLNRNPTIDGEESTCYSVDPVLKCMKDCTPIEKTSVKVGFHCFPKDTAVSLLEWQRSSDKKSASEDVVQSVDADIDCTCTGNCS